MKQKTPLVILAALVLCVVSFRVGMKQNDQRLLESMTMVASSLGHEVTEEEMLRLVVEMTYLVNDLDIQGLLKEQDTKEAALMMTVYRLLKEEKIEDVLRLSKATMEGYISREDEDTNQELIQKIRDLLELNQTNILEHTSQDSRHLSCALGVGYYLR